MKNILLFCIALKVILVASDNFVVHSIGKRQTNVAPSTALLHPIVYDMEVQSNVSNRFARTLVTSRVKNPSTTAQETTFTVVLPEKAFISEFILETEGKQFKAYVKEKEEAKQIYNQAVQRGQTAGHVSVSARDSNKFTVSVNVEPEAKAAFLLTYEELLERKNNQYELIVNIHPGQVVDNLHVQVYINESRPLTFVKTPALRSGNEIDKNTKNLDPSTDIQIIEKKTAFVKFSPDVKRQEQFAKEFGTRESEGLSGQFVVQYDVERDPHGGEVLLQDGYFIHFFAPDNLTPLSKYVVFVLDTSTSMGWGTKINQLKDAMKNILDQLNPEDFVSLIEFNTEVYGWNIDTSSKITIPVSDYNKPFDGINVEQISTPSAMNDTTITKAKNVIQKLRATGGTNIIAALEVALTSVKLYSNQNQDTYKNLQPIIMFLTDGEPYSGIRDTKEITRIITKLNLENNRVPIYSLSFGESADKDFLRKLSLKNFGFSRHIYEASDASLQLQNFYQEISSPLLSNIEFKYNDVINVTKVNYPVFYKGSEIVVGGYYRNPTYLPEFVRIHGICGTVRTTFQPRIIEKPVSSLERLWAYLTVKQKLDERDITENKEQLTKQALHLALKYSFVTDVTSLVVVKPNDTQNARLETARPSLYSDKDTVHSNKFGRPVPGWGSRVSHSYASPSHGVPPTYAASSHVAYSYGQRPGYSYQQSSQQLPYLVYTAPMSSLPAGPTGASPSVPQYNTYPSQRIYASYPHPRGPPGMRGLPAPSRDVSRVLQTPPPYLAPEKFQTTQSQKLEDSLPWLRAVLTSSKTLSINGGHYIVEENYQSTSNMVCPRTPLNINDPGSCKLLKDCPEVYPNLTDFSVYQQYFCPVDNVYAGVCCPKKVVLQST